MEEEPAEAVESTETSAALHARLVALVRAAGGEPEGREGVWMEHSYARAKSGASAVREMLSPHGAESGAVLDVGGPGDEAGAVEIKCAEEEEDPEWEARVLSLAPTALHVRAARAALDALRALRLARLAGAARAPHVRADQARAAARAVRRALARCWVHTGGPGGGVASWLHGAMLAYAGACAPLWREVVSELRLAVPRLAARLVPAPASPAPDPLASVGTPVSAEAGGPWLAWLCVGREDRWAARLRALLHVRAVTAAAPAPAAPAAWGASVAASAKEALSELIAEAGSRAVVVGGAGAGAALALALLAGAEPSPVRALALLAPPLLTAEGDATHLPQECDLPLLVVAGSAGAWCPRGLACSLRDDSDASTRTVIVRGADDTLRLPGRLRRRRNVPQCALDAAIAEEVARWAVTAAEGEPRRVTRKSAAESSDERSSAMHNARGLLREVEPLTAPTESPRGPRLRRAAPPPAAPAAPAAPLPEPTAEELDIMQLPIVFADDEPAAPVTPAPPPRRIAATGPRPSVTVTSGHPRGGRALNYTRVIVAKRRGARAGAGAPAPAPAPAPSAHAPPPARPVLLRRTVRLVRDARLNRTTPD